MLLFGYGLVLAADFYPVILHFLANVLMEDRNWCGCSRSFPLASIYPSQPSSLRGRHHYSLSVCSFLEAPFSISAIFSCCNKATAEETCTWSIRPRARRRRCFQPRL